MTMCFDMTIHGGFRMGISSPSSYINHAEIDHPRFDQDHTKHGKLWVMSWADVLLKVPKKFSGTPRRLRKWSSINENGHVDLRKLEAETAKRWNLINENWDLTAKSGASNQY